MRRFGLVVIKIAAVSIIAACSPNVTELGNSSNIIEKKPPQATNNINDIVALAFISYAGDSLDNTSSIVEAQLQSCVNWELNRQPQVKDKYSLAWGPAVYRFSFAQLDDNMMYAVTDKADPSHLIIAIRGTNPSSITDWFVEDFLVKDTKLWSVGNNIPSGARISQATSIGVRSLVDDLTDSNTKQPIVNFLQQQVSTGKIKQITVTGHSLAGALAPTFALYLSDIRTLWDNQVKTPINVVAIAGATPGNAVFAQYYDSQLGNNTHRLHNFYDVVPHAWHLADMAKLDNLYSAKGINPTSSEQLAFRVGRWLAKDRDYTQITANTPPVPHPNIANLINILDSKGSLIKENTYINQLGFQHHCGYYQALGINKTMYQTNSMCISKAQCDFWQRDDTNKYNENCAPLYNPVPLCQAKPL